MKGLFSRRVLMRLATSGLAARPSATAWAKSAQSSSVTIFADDQALRRAAVPRGVELVAIAAGGHQPRYFRRAERVSQFIPAITDAVGGLWQLVINSYIDVREFGAVGDGIADDTEAIQMAIDCAIYEPAVPGTVLLPAGRYRVRKTLHIGYGNRFSTLTLLGETFQHATGREATNSLIEPSFHDSPCINVQGGRRVHIRRLALRGVNHDYLTSKYDLIPDRTNRASWFGDSVQFLANNRTAPYAGIAIDAYAGKPGKFSYPPVHYPAYSGITTQYEKNFSSHVFIEDCQINGFGVGIIVQPSHVPDASNGDFLTIRDCDISYNVTGVALTQSDARCNNIENCRIHFCHTALDGVNFGNGRGAWMGVISGCSFDNVALLLDIDVGGRLPQGGSSPIFLGCYGESIHSLGSFLPSESRLSGTITFDHCKFQFSVKRQEFSPKVLLAGSRGKAVFRSCLFLGGFGLHQFDCSVELRDVAAMQLLAGGAADVSHVSGIIAKAFTNGFMASGHSRVMLQHSELPIQGSNLAGAYSMGPGDFPVFAAANVNGEPTYLPWWAERLHDGHQVFSIPRAPTFEIDRKKYSLNEVRWRGSEVSFTISRSALPGFGKGPVEGILLGPGDVVNDTHSRDVYYVRAISRMDASSTSITLRRLTGLRTTDHGQSYTTDGVFATNEGSLVFSVARRYYPSSKCTKIFGDDGSSHASVRSSLAELAVPFQWVRAGDLLPFVPDWLQIGGATLTRISSLSGTIGRLELSNPLPCKIDGDCPPFVRTSY
ncbi:hypothetical protein I6F09_15155 [Bradyrhizobium sp. IC3195]|uniref:right-handed parallel beta-helix repeat-containing protein n=1 Tax=Bradyrhizobium sp. IC3195 TaxID=2793804 RepID=UPI001CD771BE|nr:glycosyl hydrolase family 28-related protein [Bradyrhizobium sp. IC3195]MCA1469232.1 hypothetical protein [Bradyrhizobium sp. IC3195]